MLSVACGMEHTLALCSDGVRTELLNANFIKYLLFLKTSCVCGR